jgi:cytochrome c peroxidase
VSNRVNALVSAARDAHRRDKRYNEVEMPRFILSLVLGAFVLTAVVAFLWWRQSAHRALRLPGAPFNYANVELPAYFSKPGRNGDNTPGDNPITDEGATLGRVLFYDRRLSANRKTACSSCHVQQHAFADTKPLSTGVHGAITDRRAMPLVNLRYYQRARFFWDERAGNLEEMVLLPIQSRIEMGQDLRTMVNRLQRDALYPGLFEQTFGDSRITARRVGHALAQFVRSLVSYQSRYDDGRARATSADDDFDNFTLQENRGKALFMRNCTSCHMKDGNEHFFVPSPSNNGLPESPAAADGGVGDVTLVAADLGLFKSPSLRNVAVTAPYGHDGRFKTLETLVDHYSDIVISNPGHDYDASAQPLRFTGSEKAALIAFLKTLTDEKFLSDPKFANPFAE